MNAPFKWFAIIVASATLAATTGSSRAQGPRGGPSRSGSFHGGSPRGGSFHGGASPGRSFSGGSPRTGSGNVRSPNHAPAHAPARVAHPAPHHSHAHYWPYSWRPYRFLFAPPVGYVTISFGGISYYRYGYAYYRPYWYDDRWIYVEVAPPAGLVVAELPPAVDRVVINGQVYYRAGTTFYAERPAPTATTATATDPPAMVPADAATAQPSLAPADPQQAAVDIHAAPADSNAPAAGEPAPEAVPPGYVVTRPPIGALVETLPATAETVASGTTTYFRVDDVYYLPVTVGDKTQYVVVQKPN